MSLDTKVKNLIINTNMTKEQYEAIDDKSNQLFFVEDSSVVDVPAPEENQSGYLHTDGANLTWKEIESGDKLPDQTDNAGKFLTTDGTTASWSDKPLVNTTTQTQNSLVFGGATGSRDGKDIVIGQNSVGATRDAGGVIIGHNINGGEHFSGVAIVSRGYYSPDTAFMAGGAVVIGKQCTNTSGKTGGVVIGDACSIKTKGAYSIVIGGSNTVTADYAIQLGGYNLTNSDDNTFKVGNNNGNFEMMDADGNVPLERLTYVTDQIGDISTALTSILGE